MSRASDHIPTVTFHLASIAQEASTLVHFSKPRATGWDSSPVVFNRHPALAPLLTGVTDDDARYRVCYQYAKTYRTEHASAFAHARAVNSMLWKSIERPFLKQLSEALETSYPAQRKILRAYVSMVPIYPRWLESWSFNVSYFAPERAREIACHEILHFLYFKKWLEVFPLTRREELETPHLVWRLSEIVDPVILAEHPYFKTLFPYPPRTYRQFQQLRINGLQPAVHLARMYRRHLKHKTSFEQFLREAWDFAERHRAVLMSA